MECVIAIGLMGNWPCTAGMPCEWLPAVLAALAASLSRYLNEIW